MYRVAVIGDKESIYGFAALGLDVHFISQSEDPVPVFRKLTQGEYAVIYITEQLASVLSEEISKFSYKTTPAIIQIPGVVGNTGAGIADVRKSVEKAVGSDIIFND
ncbi:MAG: V-type ATP synthase subunit F [Ruminococcaceae bacterium]|nr:V-type ATP synthase subunit F [Oscillospiraceae bacterium]